MKILGGKKQNIHTLWANFLDKSLYDVTWPPEPFLNFEPYPDTLFAFLWLFFSSLKLKERHIDLGIKIAQDGETLVV